MVHLARQYDARILFVECIVPPEVVLQRLAQHWHKCSEGTTATLSDGCPELYEAQRSRREAFDEVQESPMHHIAVPTTNALARSAEQVLVAPSCLLAARNAR